MISLKDKVLFCLEKYPSTRNSDIELMLKIWYEFHNSKGFIHNGRPAHYDDDLYDLPDKERIKRIRAMIQNDKANPRFLPTEEKISKARRQKEREYREYFSPSNPSRG